MVTVIEPRWCYCNYIIRGSTILKSRRDCCVFLTIVAKTPANLRWRLAKHTAKE
ncbi:MAG: hypothetical protein ACRCUY_06685 [Thermoguttaceae bacterium]